MRLGDGLNVSGKKSQASSWVWSQRSWAGDADNFLRLFEEKHLLSKFCCVPKTRASNYSL